MTTFDRGSANDWAGGRRRLRGSVLLFCTVVTAAATTAAAIFTGLQAYMALRTGERQIRAYMNASVDDTLPDANNNDDVFVNISFRNYGQTPAFHIRSYFHIHNERLSPQDIGGRLAPHDGKFHLGNNQQFGYQVPLGLSAAAYHRLVRSGEKRYVYGVITYDDVFDRPHKSNFCFQLRAQPSVARLVPCDFFDEFD